MEIQKICKLLNLIIRYLIILSTMELTELTQLQGDLEEIKRILYTINMGNCYSNPNIININKNNDNKLTMIKKDISKLKRQGEYLGTTIRIYQRDIDRDKKLIEQQLDMERGLKIIKLESDIRMEVLLTKLELKRKGLM